MALKRFTFEQNNSGGAYIGPTKVTVLAKSADEANRKAEEKGVYFDGVAFGVDCECCGDRWSPVSDRDGEDIDNDLPVWLL